MSLCLSDTSGKDDIHINDVLIEEGHAQFVADNPELVYAEDPQVVGVIVQIRVMPLSILPHSHQCCSLNLHTIETPSLVLINYSIHFMVSLHLFAMENLCTDFNNDITLKYLLVFFLWWGIMALLIHLLKCQFAILGSGKKWKDACAISERTTDGSPCLVLCL